MPAREQLVQLRKILAELFNEDELRGLCFDLGIDYDDLGGRGKTGKARELVDLMERKDGLEELVTEGRKKRPNAP